MGKSKKSAPKKSKKKNKKGSKLKPNLKRAFAGLSLLLLLIIAAGFLLHHLMVKKQPVKPIPSSKETPAHKKAVSKTPTFEIYPKEERFPQKEALRPKPIPSKLPKVAIIVDDIGYDGQIAEKFLTLDAVLTFSVFPCSPFRESIVRQAHTSGLEIMLHLPMEPVEYPMVDPGPGALLTSMSPDQLIDRLNKDLDSVPSIKGVNNHMGSRMTTVSTQMYQIFSILKKRGLYFIDSRTTPESLCRPSARLLKVPFAQRDVFLDHVQKADFIRKQIKQLIHIAYAKGEAIGIAHPYIETFDVLCEVLPDLKKKVHLVPASQIAHIIREEIGATSGKD